MYSIPFNRCFRPFQVCLILYAYWFVMYFIGFITGNSRSLSTLFPILCTFIEIYIGGSENCMDVSKNICR